MPLQVQAAPPGPHTPFREQECIASAGQPSSLGRLPETFLEQGATAAAPGRHHSSSLTTAGPRLLVRDGLPMPFEAAGLAGAAPATSSQRQVAHNQSAAAAAMHLLPGSTLADHSVDHERHTQPRVPSSGLGPALAQGWLQGLAPAQTGAASLPWLPPINPQELKACQPEPTLAGGSPQGWQEVRGTQAGAAGSSTGDRQPGSAEAGHNMPVPLSALRTRLAQPAARQPGQEQRQTGMLQAQARGVPRQDSAARPEGAVPRPIVTATFRLLAIQQASCPACPQLAIPSSIHVILWCPIEQPGPPCATCTAQLVWHTECMPQAAGILILRSGRLAANII